MFSFNGIYSGLDVNSMVDALVSAERAPKENRLARRENAANVELSAVGQLTSALEAFQTQLQTMDEAEELRSHRYTVTDESVLSASISSTASDGAYTFYVDQLASNHQIISDAIDTSDTIGSGTASFTVDGDTFSVSLSTGSLAELRDSINNTSSNTSINATIVNDNGAERLMLSSRNSGANYSITTDFSGLTGGSVTLGSLNELEAAQDANIRFGSGVSAVTITSEDNTIEDVLDGVTLTLKTTSANPQTLTISRDTDAAKTLIEEFVAAWNTLENTLDALTSYDGTTAGALLGDTQTRIMESQLRRELSSLLGSDGGAIRTLGELGLKTSSDGSMSIVTATLDDALNNQYDEVIAALTQASSTEQVLTLSSMTNSNYDQTFTDAGINGFISSSGNFLETASFELYKHDAGGGNWYIAYYDGTTSDWTVSTVTSDPATWRSGDAITVSDNEGLTGFDIYEGVNRPGTSDASVNYIGSEQGLMTRLVDILSSYLGSSGSLSTRESSIKSILTQAAEDRDDLEARMEKVRTRYQSQFTAMESLLASFSGTSDWLTSNLQSSSQSS